MQIKFNETQGWWLTLDGAEVQRAIIDYLETQGCTIAPFPKEFNARLASDCKASTFDLAGVSTCVRVGEGSITFRDGKGPTE